MDPYYRHLLPDFVRWTCRTGLRVEESLTLQWRNATLDGPAPFVTVPGSKNAQSHATLPISLETAQLLQERRKRHLDDEFIFTVHYATLRTQWVHCREYLGVADDPLST